MRFVDVSGVGNSGKSALVDLLREFDGVWAPHYSFEFDFLRVPGGLLELETWFCDDWSPIRSHAAFIEFHDVVDRMGLDPRWWDIKGLLRCTSHRYDGRFNGRFRELAVNFLESFVVGRYHAEWPYDSLRESDSRRFARKILSRLWLRRYLVREVLLIDGREFSQRATRLLNALYAEIVPPSTKWVVLNNGFEPFNPVRGLDLIGNSKQLVVTRDPRDTYVSGLNAHAIAGADKKLLPSDNDGMNKSFLATDNLELFVRRYRLYREKLYRGNDPRVLQLRFEDLINNYERTLFDVMGFLNISMAMHGRKKSSFDPQRSAKNVGIWRAYSQRDEIAYIESELAEYLVQ